VSGVQESTTKITIPTNQQKETTMTVKHKHHQWNHMTQDDINWSDNKQELTIDISKHEDESMQLILTSWKQGISWKTLVNEVIEHHNNPFEAPPFPFWFLESDLVKCWREQIPDRLLKQVKHFKGNEFGILNFCSRYQYADKFFTHNPTLFWMIFMNIQKHSKDEAALMAICQLKHTTILKILKLPAKKSVLKLLLKIKYTYALNKYGRIERLFKLKFEKLNHRASISIAQIAFILQFPEFIESPLLNQWEQAQSIDELQSLPRVIRDIDLMKDQIREINKKSIKQQLYQCKDSKAIHRLHDKLVEQLNKQNAEEDEQERLEWGHQEYQLELPTQFPEPPLAGNPSIIPITTPQQLQREGQKQQHCVAAYAYQIAQNQCYIYQILAPERATLSIDIRVTPRGKTKLSIDQIKGFKNKEINKETRTAVLDWFKQTKKDKNTFISPATKAGKNND